jgi:hypothetical protein
MLEREDFWQQCNLVWSWIDERPVWLSPVDWYLEVLPDPRQQEPSDGEMQQRFRLTLLGGGQITVIEHFTAWRPSSTELLFHCDSQPRRRRSRLQPTCRHGRRSHIGVAPRAA